MMVCLSEHDETMRLLTMIPLLALAGVMASCSSTSGVRIPPGPQSVEPTKALVLPPPGGPSVVSVIEQRHGNEVEQSIALYTSSSVPGQNFFKVQFIGPAADDSGSDDDSFRVIRESDLSREMVRAVPTVRLTSSPIFLQNSYGPFSYASGRSAGGDTCLYAWQQIHSGRPGDTPFHNLGMIQVRLRLCDAHASERQLLSVIYNYTITGTFNGTMWSPFGNAPHVDPTLGATGAPIYPDASGYRTNPMASGYQPAPTGVAFGGRSVVPQVAPRRPAPTSVPQAPVLPAPVGPRVPSPDLPQLSPQAATVPDHEQQQARAIGVTVPSPTCLGEAAMTAACQK